MAGVKVPMAIECTLIDPREERIPLTKDEQVDDDYFGLKQPSIYDKVGIPEIKNPNQKEKSAFQRTSGVYFMSNELTQDFPLPENLQQRMKILYDVMEINPAQLATPSLKVSKQLHEIIEQIMIFFQLDNMVSDRKDDLDILMERELQIKELVNAHTWEIKQELREQLNRGIKQLCIESGLPQQETDKAGITNRIRDPKQQREEDLEVVNRMGIAVN